MSEIGRLLILLWPALDPCRLPPLSDLERFPPNRVVKGQWAESSRWKLWLREQDEKWESFYDADPYRAILIEQHRKIAQEIHEAWDELDDAQDTELDYEDRREALGKLRQLLGPVGYAKGIMPPAIPYQMVRERD